MLSIEGTMHNDELLPEDPTMEEWNKWKIAQENVVYLRIFKVFHSKLGNNSK